MRWKTPQIACPKCGFILLNPENLEEALTEALGLFPVHLQDRLKLLRKYNKKYLQHLDVEFYNFISKARQYTDTQIQYGIDIYIKEKQYLRGMPLTYCLAIIKNWTRQREQAISGGKLQKF